MDYIKNIKRIGEDKLVLDLYRSECAEAIEKSKHNHLNDLGKKLSEKGTGQKTYWKIVNSLLNKCKIPRIPPILVANKFVINCKEKAAHFNNFFVSQCQPFQNTSKLPDFNLLTDAKVDSVEITNKQILDILHSLKVNKAHGPDEISVNMIKWCANS